MLLDSNEITTANKNINNTLSTINEQKTNADALANSFIKEVIQNNKQSFIGMFTNTNVQPSNYSFVAFSADVTPVNYKYARRTVWNGDEPSSRILANTNSITDVSWIYSLAGTNTKYQFSFNNYGPSTGYLYFPYKLVKAADANNVGLQYKLNNGTVQPVEFATSTSANNTTANQAPAVDEIKVAKIVLSGLRFGQNTIELSVPTGEGNMNKVAPMIGNIYLSSNENNADKIYNDIFGNTINQQNNAISVMVNMVEGYNLASSYSPTYKLINVSTGGGQTQPYYVIGWLGASDQNPRNAVGTNMNVQRVPATNSNQGGYARYVSFYVNAPQAGSYYISGNYNSLTARGLAVSTEKTFTTNVIKITHLQVINATNRILTFDTKTKRGTDSNNGNITLEANKDTITLTKGWNKLYVSGNNNDSVGIGNLTFTLMPPQTNSN